MNKKNILGLLSLFASISLALLMEILQHPQVGHYPASFLSARDKARLMQCERKMLEMTEPLELEKDWVQRLKELADKAPSYKATKGFAEAIKRGIEMIINGSEPSNVTSCGNSRHADILTDLQNSFGRGNPEKNWLELRLHYLIIMCEIHKLKPGKIIPKKFSARWFAKDL